MMLSIELNQIIGLCSLGTALVLLYVSYFSWRDARAQGGPLAWPLHGRYVIFLFLFVLGLAFLNGGRLWLSGGRPDWTWFVTLGLESRSVLSTALFATAIWFTRRWRAGTLLTHPKPGARGSASRSGR